MSLSKGPILYWPIRNLDMCNGPSGTKKKNLNGLGPLKAPFPMHEVMGHEYGPGPKNIVGGS
uniref:Uncharacterized protein n=1 Tax=Solanum lycopersicum TaxID=4081 RepID=A0A3Q7GNG6_SOLLC